MGDGKAVQWADVVASPQRSISGASSRPGALRQQGDDSIDDGIDPVDLLEMRLQHLDRGNLTVLDPSHQLPRGHEVQFVAHTDMLLLLDDPTRILAQGL